MRGPALLSLALLAGCIGRSPVAARPDLGAARVIAQAADRIRACYRAPRVGRAAGRIVTLVDVAFAPDGSLAELPRVSAQSGVDETNRREADLLAQAAVLAVIRCAPLKLPAERYRGGWDSFRLTFSPKAVA